MKFLQNLKEKVMWRSWLSLGLSVLNGGVLACPLDQLVPCIDKSALTTYPTSVPRPYTPFSSFLLYRVSQDGVLFSVAKTHSLVHQQDLGVKRCLLCWKVCDSLCSNMTGSESTTPSKAEESYTAVFNPRVISQAPAMRVAITVWICVFLHTHFSSSPKDSLSLVLCAHFIYFLRIPWTPLTGTLSFVNHWEHSSLQGIVYFHTSEIEKYQIYVMKKGRFSTTEDRLTCWESAVLVDRLILVNN